MRTPEDKYTPHGRYRIYNRDHLVNAEHSALHVTGRWYVEPSNWVGPEPRQRGYETYEEARDEAHVIERLWLNAEVEFGTDIPLPAGTRETAQSRALAGNGKNADGSDLRKELSSLVEQAKEKGQFK